MSELKESKKIDEYLKEEEENENQDDLLQDVRIKQDRFLNLILPNFVQRQNPSELQKNETQFSSDELDNSARGGHKSAI